MASDFTNLAYFMQPPPKPDMTGSESFQVGEHTEGLEDGHPARAWKRGAPSPTPYPHASPPFGFF